MANFIISFVVWALAHSVTAANRTKQFFRRRLGERVYVAWYRLGYNLFAVLTFIPVLYFLWVDVPGTRLYAVPFPWNLLTSLIQLIGLVGLAVALLQTDIWEFVGLRQAIRYLQGKEKLTLPPKLVTSGAYALVRHPLYFFSMLIIWFTPVMTLQTLIFNLLATAYFWAGSRVEERRLADFFGPAYEVYREKVPGLVPVKLPF